VAEVHNTPWGEQHCYVLTRDRRTCSTRCARRSAIRFAKDFHVSPFMGMDQHVRLALRRSGAQTRGAHGEHRRTVTPIFDATMVMQRRPITSLNLARVLAALSADDRAGDHAAIYYQALRALAETLPVPSPSHAVPPRHGDQLNERHDRHSTHAVITARGIVASHRAIDRFARQVLAELGLAGCRADASNWLRLRSSRVLLGTAEVWHRAGARDDS
jgi:DUF1365 family protein